MKKVEILLVSLILIGIISKIFSLNGSETLITIPFLTLSFLYFLGGIVILNNIPLRGIFKSSSYSITWKKIIWAAIAGFFLSMAALSLLYPIMSWEGNLIVLKLFNILLLPIFITSLTILISHKSPLHENILVRSGIILCIALIEIVLMRYNVLMIK